ncbi:MAG: insulinase family protein, partial [Pseudomonadota bacterium]
KRYLTGAYPLRFDSNAKIAGQLVGLMSQGFTPDYIRERNGLIEAVTLEDVARVAERLLRPDRLHVVVVGRPQGLGDG